MFQQVIKNANLAASSPDSIEGPGYRLKWRMGQLIVRATPSQNETVHRCGPEDWFGLVDCLHRSRVTRIKLDLALDASMLVLWADAGKAAGKPTYLSLPSSADLPQRRSAWGWRFKRGADRVAAVLVVLLLSPVLAALMLWVRAQTQETILVREWHVGERGRLYESVKLRTMTADGRWLRGADRVVRYRLDRLAKLLNVLRGEMSLVGACPQRLNESAGCEAEFQGRLNALPGVMGAWLLEARWQQLELTVINHLDLTYLQEWSLWQDLRLLVLSLPHWVDDYV
jgi:lipopolysaccharide/colanic/teichoic acid biosynthesis glycosyltransferase